MDSLRFVGTQLCCQETVISESHFQSHCLETSMMLSSGLAHPPMCLRLGTPLAVLCLMYACLRIKMDFIWRQYPLNSSFLDPIFISKGAEIEIKCLNTLFPKWVMLQFWAGGGRSQPGGFCQFTVVYPAGPELQPGLHLQWSNPLMGSLCGDLGYFSKAGRVCISLHCGFW